MKLRFIVVRNTNDHRAAFAELAHAIEWAEHQMAIATPGNTWVIEEHDGKGHYRLISKQEKAST